MCVCDKLHITDPIFKNKRADGGIFARYENVSADGADVIVTVNVDNEYTENRSFVLSVSLNDKSGNICAETEKEIMVDGGCSHTESFVLHVKNPQLWSPENPYLYTLTAQLISNAIIDSKSETIGIRHLEFKHDGFYLNGVKTCITGANRHHQYPHIGIAVSDNAHYREMKLLKDGGFNFLRLCHYPQSPAVYKACDELGIMVADCTPGWQWCKADGPFKGRVYQNIRDMIRRDRNHPCVIMWEVSLNETGASEEFMWNDRWSGADDDFMHMCHLTAHEEYPGNQLYTSGDSIGRDNPAKVDFDIPYPLGVKQWYEMDVHPSDKPFFRREYGDFEFGFNFSTTRQERKFGEHAMLNSAWNFVYSHNLSLSKSWMVGSAIWVGIDYTRPYFIPEPICAAGALDIFRIPKFSYYYFASQQEKTPVLYIANYWSDYGSLRKVVVFSNCDEVELLVNGHSVARQKPDSGKITSYKLPDKFFNAGYWHGNKTDNIKNNTLDFTREYKEAIEKYCFDGDNCSHCSHPPFSFSDIPYEEGSLTAIGYKNGKEIMRQTRISNPIPYKIVLETADMNIPLKNDGVDFIFAYAHINNKNGFRCFEAENEIHFKIEGGEIIGRDTLKAEAGTAPVMIRKNADKLTLAVSSEGLVGDKCIL